MLSNNIIRFNDLTDEEKLALNDEKVTEFVKIECAFEGVKVLPYPTEPIEPPVGEKKEYWRIAYHSDFTFAKKEEAEAVMSLLKQSDIIETNYCGDLSYVSKIRKYNGTLNSEFYNTIEQYEKMKVELEAYHRAKTNYDALKKEYDKEIKLYRDIEDDIWKQINKVRELHESMEDLMVEYLSYLRIAKGNHEIALGFLEKTYKDNLAVLHKGLGKAKYEVWYKGLALLEFPKEEVKK